MQQVRDRAVSTRLPRAKPASPAQARSVSHDYATYELRVQKGPSHDATRRRMAQKSPYRAESAVLLRGAAGTSGAQKLATRPTGGPEEGTTATGGAQRAEGVELGKSDAQWPGGFGVPAVRLFASSEAGRAWHTPAVAYNYRRRVADDSCGSAGRSKAPSTQQHCRAARVQ